MSGYIFGRKNGFRERWSYKDVNNNLQRLEAPLVPGNVLKPDNVYAEKIRHAKLHIYPNRVLDRHTSTNANKTVDDEEEDEEGNLDSIEDSSNTGNPSHEELRINEDTSMALLADTMASPQKLSAAASIIAVPVTIPDFQQDQEENPMKEWIPQFPRSYSYFSLFRFASAVDYTFMVIGTVAAMGAGCCIPAIIYLLGNLIRAKALVDKMNCTNKEGPSSACKQFLDNCNENHIDHSLFSDRRFLETYLVQNNSVITTEHMESFVRLELPITFAYMLLTSIYFFCWNYASQNQGGKLRRAYFESLLQKDMSWFETQDNPDAFNRMMENTRRITEGMGESIPTAINLIVMCCLCVPLAVFHGWQLSLVCLAILPFSLGSIWLQNRWKATRILKERRAYRVAHDLAKEVISNIRTVIGYNLQLTERALYQREISRWDGYVIKAIFLESVAVGLMYVVNFGLWAIAFWYGMELVLHDTLKTCTDKSVAQMYDAGDLFIILLSILFGVSNIYNVGVVMSALKVAKLCGREVLKVIDAPNGIESLSTDGIVLEEAIQGKVEFIDVRFTYPGKNRRLALNHLSFVVEPNTMVAIVGLSDSGKSTTLKLICKEYLADSGIVQIDGHDIRSLNTKWLRSQIAFIPQEVHLFDMTIEDNVRMGKLGANFFEIQEACMKAGAHDFIISFKDGYQTKLGHKGSKLTPGQKQLLAIARALIRDPKILLLDEPTNALDSQSVIEFMRSLQTISRDRTVILVAHRLATVVPSKMIYVLKNGKVVEQGEHHKLIKRKGPYNQLCMMSRPSKSYHPGELRIEGFDTSEMTIISCMKTFSQKLILPNLYNNLLSVDPVVSNVTDAILNTDNDTERGFHAKLEWTLEEAEELHITSVQEDDRLGKGLQGVADLDMNELIDANANGSLTDVKYHLPNSGKDSIAEEYHAISILNTDKSIWLRVITIGSTSHWLIFFGVLSTILLSIGIPTFGYILALVIDVLSDIQGYPRNWKWASAFFVRAISFPMMITFAIMAIGGYSGIFALFQDFFLNLAGYKSVKKIRRLLYHSILNQDISFFEDPKHSPLALASILFQDTDSIRHLTFGVYASIFQCLGMFIVPVTLCLVHSPGLTAYTLLIVMMVVGSNFFDGWLAKRQHGKTIEALQHMSNLILQVFQSKHVITVCQIEPYYLKEFTTLQRKSFRTIKGLSCVRIFTYGISQSAVFWGFGLFVHLGKERIRLGADSFLDIMINGFLIVFGLFNLGMNLSVIMSFKYIIKGGKRMLEIINRQPLLAHDEGLSITEEDCTKEIEFVNAHFWRHHAPDSTLLKGINLTIPPLQVTSIVGYPESGKSAFLELLGRYYDATGGLVTIAGSDIRYYSSDSLREHLSVVSKIPELFSRTVAQNIALGATFREPSMEEVIQAAEEANAHHLIVSLPEGYETRIGGERDYLSGTQKQKISIARALLKNPKILILDDITSQLDKEGEKEVLELITRIKENRTVIMISESIQPVQDSDWIVLMEKGYLEEQGRHDQLLRQRTTGIYAQMWKAQNPLEDENFLKGTAFAGKRLPEKIEKIYSRQKVPPAPQKPPVTAEKILQPPRKGPVQPTAVPNSLPPQPEQKIDEPEPTTMCGGIFSFLGLGIVDEMDEIDNDVEEGGDNYRK